MAAAEEAAFRPSYYGLGSLEMPDAEDINMHEDEDRDFIENLRATAQRKQPAEHDVKYWGGADQPWRNGTNDSPIIDEAIIAREELRRGEADLVKRILQDEGIDNGRRVTTFLLQRRRLKRATTSSQPR